jgi:hypothetical protein
MPNETLKLNRIPSLQCNQIERFFTIGDVFIFEKFHENYIHLCSYMVALCPGDVAQWTSHPPQEQQDPGSNPARV